MRIERLALRVLGGLRDTASMAALGAGAGAGMPPCHAVAQPCRLTVKPLSCQAPVRPCSMCGLRLICHFGMSGRTFGAVARFWPVCR